MPPSIVDVDWTAFIHHPLGSHLIVALSFGFAGLVHGAGQSTTSLARSVLLHVFCGPLLGLRNQLLRFLDRSRFLRIREVSDLSSFTCFWHCLTIPDIGQPRCSV